jgi:Cu(I)/Ag(I) efflux system membrane fusion protein
MKKASYLAMILAVATTWYFLINGYKYATAGSTDCAAHVSSEHGGESEEDASSMPPGTVRISPERQQIVGIRIGEAEKKALTQTIRLLGTVAADETRLYFINATVDGWITKTYPNTTGSIVKKNETLATFYSPEFLSASQALLFALGSVDRLKARAPTGEETPAQKDQMTQFNVNLQQYKDSLRNLGMGDLQIEEMIRTRRFMENVNITSPADGFILIRNVSLGLRFEKGWEFYRIADLSRVWILADVYEREAECFQPGIEAKVILPYQKKTYQAKVSEVLPVYEPKTRTLKVRLETDNPAFALRPEMLVNVELPITYPAVVTVPEDAVLDSGTKKTVFVYRDKGFFEPREVETDRHMGNRVEIVNGLEAGEKIATSGNFLIDSESKMELAAAGMYVALRKDPVCGMEVSVSKAEKSGGKSTFGRKTYYFCSPECKHQFEKEPGRYVKE